MIISMINSPWFWALLLSVLAVLQTAAMYFGMRFLQRKREASLLAAGRNIKGDLGVIILKILKYWLVPSLFLCPLIGYFVIAPVVSGSP